MGRLTDVGGLHLGGVEVLGRFSVRLQRSSPAFVSNGEVVDKAPAEEGEGLSFPGFSRCKMRYEVSVSMEDGMGGLQQPSEHKIY